MLHNSVVIVWVNLQMHNIWNRYPPQLHLTSYFWKFCMSHLPFGIVLLSLCVYVCQNLQMYINIYTRDKCVCRQANLYLMGNLFVIHHLLIVDAITKADVFAWLHLFFFQWWMGGLFLGVLLIFHQIFFIVFYFLCIFLKWIQIISIMHSIIGITNNLTSIYI